MIDRFNEMRASLPDSPGGCQKDALFHRLNTLDRTTIETDHDDLIAAIIDAVEWIGAHKEYAETIIAQIRAEKARVEHAQARVCTDIDGTPCGPVVVKTDAEAA